MNDDEIIQSMRDSLSIILDGDDTMSADERQAFARVMELAAAKLERENISVDE